MVWPIAYLFRIIRSEWKPLLAGIVVALLARAYVVDIYGVRKHSMEPTLHDPEGGATDRVAVFKLAQFFSPPARWDLWVFQRDGQGHNVVKRVLGLPGEYIQIIKGDVFLGPNADSLQLLRKEPELLESLLVPIADLSRRPLKFPRDETWKFAPERWGQKKDGLVAQPGPAGEAATLKYYGLPHCGYILPNGEVNHPFVTVRDFGVELEFQPLAATTRLQINIRTGEKHFSLLVRADTGGIEMCEGGKRLQMVENSGLRKLEQIKLRFVQADRRLYLWVNQDVFTKDLGPWPMGNGNLRLTPVDNSFGLAVTGGGARIPSLKLVRDLHYNDEECRHGTKKAEPLAENEYFMLGDNTCSSEDSRHYGAVQDDWLVGQPIMVVLPLSRVKWL